MAIFPFLVNGSPMRRSLTRNTINILLAILTIEFAVTPFSHAQAPGVSIAEQSGKGRDRDDDRVREVVAELNAAEKLFGAEELKAQTSKPLSRRISLPAPFEKSLGAAEIAKKARASVMRVG